jgi:YbbR domain-containing protein
MSTKKKTFSIGGLLYNRNFLIVLSFIAAICIWIAVSLNASPDISRTIKNVKVTVDDSVPSQLGYKAYGADNLYVDVTVKGKRYLVGNNVLSADDIKVTAVTSYVDAPGAYTLQLKASAAGTKDNFTITGKSEDYIQVYFDKPETKEFQITPVVNCSGDLLYSDDYVNADPVLSSDTIKISGPAAEVDKITSVKATITSEGALKSSETYKATVSITDASGNTPKYLSTNLSKSGVTVTVPVYKRTTLPVSVSFKNSPLYYIDSPLSITAAPSEVNVGIPEAQMSSMTAAAVGTVDFADINAGINTFTFPVSKITGMKITDNIDTVTVNVDASAMTSRLIDITTGDITVKNAASKYKVTVSSADISGIKVIGPYDNISALTADDISAVIDLSGVTLKTGTQKVSMKLSCSDEKCWIYGNYKAVIYVTKA